MGVPNVVAGMQVNIIGDATPFARAMDQATSIAKKQAKEIREALNRELQESNHSLALFGDVFGVTIPRHIRTFISELPGVSKAMSTAFNTFAVIALIDVLVKAGEEVKKLIEAYDHADKKAGEMAQAFGHILEPMQQASDEIQVQKDHLQKLIDKLEKKPHNGIKDAIDEAIVEADRLLAKLSAASEKMSEELRKQSVGAVRGFVTGQASDKNVANGLDAANRHLQDVMRDFSDKLRDATAHGATDKELEDIKKQALAAGAGVNTRYTNELYHGTDEHGKKLDTGYASFDEAQRKQKEFEASKGAAWKINGNPNVNTTVDYSHILQSEGAANVFWKRSYSDFQDMFALSALQKRADVDEAKHQNDQVSKKADQNQLRDIQIMLEGFRTATEKLAFLRQLTDIRAGNKDWFYGVPNQYAGGKRLGGELAKVGVEAQKEQDAQDKQDIETLNQYNREQNQAQQKIIEQYARYSAEQEKAIQAAGKNAVEWIQFNEKINKTSPADAARQTTQSHLDEFAKLTSNLITLRNSIEQETHGPMTDTEAKEWQADHDRRYKAADDKVQAATDAYALQSAMDAYNESMQGAMGGVRKFWEEFQKDADATGEHIHSILSNFMSGINSDIADAMMGKKVNWSKTFEGAGHSMAESGLKSAESGLMKAFGLGKRGSSPANPLYVVETSMGQLAKGAGGFFSKLFGGMFADGGDPDPYKASIVGERGPELFIPHGVSGTIIPNNKLGGGAGSGGNVYNIDATGTNAADVERRVIRGSQMAYQQALKDSAKQHSERNARVPSRSRS